MLNISFNILFDHIPDKIFIWFTFKLLFTKSRAFNQRFYLEHEKSYSKRRIDKLVANNNALKTNEVHVDAPLMMHQITLCSAILLNFN